MFELLAEYPLLLLALILFAGSLLGTVRVAGASLGPAAVLFVALGLTAWGMSHGVELMVPEILGNFGLILFTFMIGIISGPNFFGSLKRGWPVMLSTLGALVVAAIVAGVAGRLLGLENPVIAGTFAGALTNTPALAAAGQAAGGAELPAVGYSLSYLWGVIGMMLAAAWALRKATKDEDARAAAPIEQTTIRIEMGENVSVADLLKRHPGAVNVTRVQHDESLTVVAEPDEMLLEGDRISVVGPHDALVELTKELGHTSSVDIIHDRTHLDFARVTLSASKLAGLTVGELKLGERFGAQISRVRRGDVDMIATEDFHLQMGDRLRVVGPRDTLKEIRAFLGDSERGFSDINPIGLALGLLIGVGIGMIPLPLPMGHFTIGSAAGTLIMGLIFGRIGRIGPVPLSMSTSAAHSLSGLGMLVFLAFAGTRAGTLFTDALTSSLGWKVILLGFVITLVAAVALLAAARLFHRTDWVQISGQLGGAQTQPAVLAFANTRTAFDIRVSLGYALVYPVAMVGKILLAQLLVIFG